MHSAGANQVLPSVVPAPDHAREPVGSWHARRKQQLLQWGRQREEELHRPPAWCMDQLCSGSGFFPPRHLHDDWFTEEERGMIARLQGLLAPTGHAAALARDMMALRLYDVDVRIIADDSGSMTLGMLKGSGRGRGGGRGSRWTEGEIRQVFGQRAFRPDAAALLEDSPFGPSTVRWEMLCDALTKWEEVLQIMGVGRSVYLLNGGRRDPREPMQSSLASGPRGGTPMGSTLQRVLSDYRSSGRGVGRPLLVLALTDGEANDADVFNRTLDGIQDGAYGDVQVLLMGLSLDKEDIEFFEDEECDDTRIRTIEAYEVEQQLILYRKVIQRNTDYNFAMHTYRALVTNYFPADYDYEAPVQTLRHRLYITLHALDRRITGNRDAKYSDFEPSNFNCTPGGALAVALLSALGFAFRGPSGCLGACAVSSCFAMAAPRQRGGSAAGSAVSSTTEEGFSGTDDASIGNMIRQLQQRVPSGGRSARWCIDPSALSSLQRAIGILYPSEASMRDYQYQNIEGNNKSLRRATSVLLMAARKFE